MKKIALILFALTLTVAASAQSDNKLSLYQTVAALDKKLFDAYNNCDLKTLGEMVSDDLEFYHDQTGLEVGKDPFIQAIKKNICGKVTRELIASSLEVHPLKTYGALEMGNHRFLHPSDTANPPGEAPFIMLWQQKGDSWKLTRVISYEHHLSKQ